MNSRILKKLCKRAENYPEAFKELERVHSGDNDPLNLVSFDRKHKLRWCRPKSVSANYVQIWRNTSSYGQHYGYYEPEWEDHPAYFILRSLYQDKFVTWDEHGPIYTGPRNPPPSEVFRHFGI